MENFILKLSCPWFLKAFDLGDPPLYSEVNVTIHVQDVNDNPPQFEREEYKVQIAETHPTDREVIRVRITNWRLH